MNNNALPDYDYIIIGSGFGGSVCALRLAEKGYKVAVLEAGKRFKPQDFAKTNWQLHRFLWSPKLLLKGILRISLFKHVMVLSGAGVGGGSLVYGNTLLRPKDSIWQTDWPQSVAWQEELSPFYDTAEKMLGVVENPYLGNADRELKKAATAQGFGSSFYATKVAVYFGEPGKLADDPYFNGAGPKRTGCTLKGACLIGCRDGGKNTLDKNYLYFAEKKGVTIFPETLVTDVRSQVGGGYVIQSESSTHLFKKNKTTWTTKGVIFSAGVLGTLKLLLTTKASGSLSLLSNALGKNVLTNSESLISVRKFAKEVDFSDGIAIGSGIYIDEHTHIEAVRYPKGSDALGPLIMPMTQGKTAMERFISFLTFFAKHPLRCLKILNPFGMARQTIILLVMQTTKSSIDLILKKSFLFPSHKKLATQGASIPSCIPNANEFARNMAKEMQAEPQASWADVVLDRPITAHIIGGAKMAETADDGVVDTNNRVFHYDNMYVCDGSVIASNLGVNPSLSILALTERAMSKIPNKEGESA